MGEGMIRWNISCAVGGLLSTNLTQSIQRWVRMLSKIVDRLNNTPGAEVLSLVTS